MEKKCTKCGELKTVSCFSKSKYYKDGFHIYCKPCRVKLNRENFLNHPETQRVYKRKWNASHKEKVFLHYGKGEIECAMCGFSDARALTIDHVEGGGNKHRKEVGSNYVYRWIVKNNFPSGFQILCMNCQFIKIVENDERHSQKD